MFYVTKSDKLTVRRIKTLIRWHRKNKLWEKLILQFKLLADKDKPCLDVLSWTCHSIDNYKINNGNLLIMVHLHNDLKLKLDRVSKPVLFDVINIFTTQLGKLYFDFSAPWHRLFQLANTLINGAHRIFFRGGLFY